MFDKVYKAYLDLNANTKQHLILTISDASVFLSTNIADLFYVGNVSDVVAAPGTAADTMRHFEKLYPDQFEKWG